ncbi:MAG: heavy metal translocating P-type ATPase [Alkalispirochaeta sp.]
MSKNIQLHIEGMTCTSCAAAVEKALGKVPQVEVAQVNFAGKKALLQFSDETADTEETRQILKKAVTDAGYAVVDADDKRAQASEHVAREFRRMVWSWILTVPLMVQMLLHMIWGIELLPGPVAAAVVPLVVAGVVIFGIGFPVIRSTFNSFRTFSFTMDSLIGIGAIAAFSTGILRLFGVSIENFTSVGAMVVAINYIGSYIKAKATGQASSAIQQLLEMGAKQATRLGADGSESVIDVAELGIGDVVRVRPGEKVPADGRIVRGSTSIDESIVTGESVPSDKGVGSEVVGGTINQMGTIEVTIEKTGEDTFLSRIIDMVEEAQASRVPVQELADRVTAVFVPAILVLSVLTFVVWAFIVGPGDLSRPLSAAIATLVIACPCALGLATPTALMVGMGFGAERGILIRNGEAIQTARDIDVVVFDKTGTLTVGRPEVLHSIGTEHGMTRAVEEGSEHPLARALVTYLSDPDASGPGLSEPETAVGVPQSEWVVQSSQASPGHGITAVLERPERGGSSNGHEPVTARVGSVRWLESEGASLDDGQREHVAAWRADGMTVVGTAVDGEMTALYALSDTIKTDAAAAIRTLHTQGLRTAMLTGDSEAAAHAIARTAGIDDVFAELLPEQKIDAVRQLQGEGKVVAMVGDGINDAPALKQANVGIAIGTGTDIAIESADITLMSSSLEMIPRAVEISRRTFRKIQTNLFWAFFYNIVAIPLAVAGLLHPVVAEIAMAFSSITVVTNSLHLKRILARIGKPAGVDPVEQTKTKEMIDMGLFGSGKKVSYRVEDMTCGHCEAKVTAALSELPNVKKVKASAKSKEVVIEYTGDDAPDLDTVNTVLEPAGYPAQVTA